MFVIVHRENYIFTMFSGGPRCVWEYGHLHVCGFYGYGERLVLSRINILEHSKSFNIFNLFNLFNNYVWGKCRVYVWVKAWGLPYVHHGATKSDSWTQLVWKVNAVLNLIKMWQTQQAEDEVGDHCTFLMHTGVTSARTTVVSQSLSASERLLVLLWLLKSFVKGLKVIEQETLFKETFCYVIKCHLFLSLMPVCHLTIGASTGGHE